MFYLMMILVLFVVGLLLLGAKFEEAKFHERFPRIGDDEFVRRCGPEVSHDTAIRVRRILSDALGVDYERIYPEQTLVEDLDCDNGC